MQDEAHPMGGDGLDGLNPLMQQLGRCPFVPQEAEFDILRREGVPVVERQALAQLELVRQPVVALTPRLRQAGGHITPR
jgi:hypothetical protein